MISMITMIVYFTGMIIAWPIASKWIYGRDEDAIIATLFGFFLAYMWPFIFIAYAINYVFSKFLYKETK